ncbi:MAG TPA: OmpA family protein [Candidatus Ozemobacteraceae bacterium]
MKQSKGWMRALARSVALCTALVCAGGSVMAGPAPRYDVTFGQQGNEVQVQVVPARAGVATHAMPVPDAGAVTGIVGSPVVRPTSVVFSKPVVPPTQLQPQSVADYKEDGFDVSIDAISGEVVSGQLAETGRISLAILFEADSSAVDQGDATTMQALNQVLALLKAQPDLRIAVEGYVDYTGVKEYEALGQSSDGGLGTSEKRAASVKAWLIAKGIAATRITSVGKGTRGQLGDSEEQRAKNRRVDIVKQSE